MDWSQGILIFNTMQMTGGAKFEKNYSKGYCKNQSRLQAWWNPLTDL